MSENLSFDNLLPATRETLNRLNNSEFNFLNNFVLVGGSALAIRIGHRQSEDLDFFTYKNWFDKEKIFKVTQSFKDRKIISQKKDSIDLRLNGVKVSFVNMGAVPTWSFLKPDINNKVGNINIASLDQLSAMKVHVIFLRNKFRDYYDLYVLTKDYMNINKIYNNAEKMIPGITFRLFSIALTYTREIKDENINYLTPRYNITKEQISSFFETKIKEYIEQLNKTINNKQENQVRK